MVDSEKLPWRRAMPVCRPTPTAAAARAARSCGSCPPAVSYTSSKPSTPAMTQPWTPVTRSRNPVSSSRIADVPSIAYIRLSEFPCSRESPQPDQYPYQGRGVGVEAFIGQLGEPVRHADATLEAGKLLGQFGVEVEGHVEGDTLCCVGAVRQRRRDQGLQ